uniref:Clusterin-associated protein 1 n=1 Tax=Haemonchus contortus TaxID=6289 RepID=A0A7I4YML7_HAECO|nr:Clusterin-associated protein-1 domain containing protein [Haemonchus contortus]
MSYRERRNLCEMTKAIGYPRILSLENFRTPNFRLVAELLEWIVKRFDPSATISAEHTTTEQDRVLFIKQAVLLLLQNSRLRLNPRRLYQADGNAVQELLPAVKLLYESGKQLPAEDVNAHWNAIKNKLNAKMQEIRIARQLATQLPQTGAALHDLLGKELYCRDQRNRAVSRAIPLAEAERTIQQSIEAISADTGDFTNKLSNVANDEAALDEKIERKKREYEQMQKRFVKLQSFRPQYMDEYEKLEAKLKQLYEVYVVKFRNLAYLQQLQLEIERTDRQKQEESERTMRQVVEKMRMDLNNQDEPIEEEVPPINQARRNSTRKVYGNMTGAGMSDDDDDNGETGAGVVHTDSDEEQHKSPLNDDPEKLDLSSGDDF